jgi:nitrous oxidase accessory protein NosD
MVHPISRRRLATLAAGLTLALALVPMIASPVAATSSHLYVSKFHSSDSNPCTAWRPCRTIGHAVAVATPGTTIHVGRGTYHEQVSITERLTLVGWHAVIDATGQTGGIEPLKSQGIVGYGVLIFGPGASGSGFRGFTVQHAIGEGILVAGTSKIRIDHNVVRYNDTGFGTNDTLECQAQGEIPGDCGEGLHLIAVTWSKVLHNRVERNVGGVLVTDEIGPSAHNVIAYNVIRYNKEDCGITLPSHNPSATTDPSLGGVYANLIYRNWSIGNGGAGVGMFAPFPGAASYNNKVIGNVLRNNGEAGAAIHGHAPGQNVSGNVIWGNWLSGNGVDPDAASGHRTGIALLSVDPTSVTVARNHIAHEYWGIFVNGPFTIHGLSTNHYASSVAHHHN